MAVKAVTQLCFSPFAFFEFDLAPEWLTRTNLHIPPRRIERGTRHGDNILTSREKYGIIISSINRNLIKEIFYKREIIMKENKSNISIKDVLLYFGKIQFAVVISFVISIPFITS